MESTPGTRGPVRRFTRRTGLRVRDGIRNMANEVAGDFRRGREHFTRIPSPPLSPGRQDRVTRANTTVPFSQPPRSESVESTPGTRGIVRRFTQRAGRSVRRRVSQMAHEIARDLREVRDLATGHSATPPRRSQTVGTPSRRPQIRVVQNLGNSVFGMRNTDDSQQSHAMMTGASRNRYESAPSRGNIDQSGDDGKTDEELMQRAVDYVGYSDLTLHAENPFADPQDNPFADPTENPFIDPQDNPFADPPVNPFADPTPSTGLRRRPRVIPRRPVAGAGMVSANTPTRVVSPSRVSRRSTHGQLDFGPDPRASLASFNTREGGMGMTDSHDVQSVQAAPDPWRFAINPEGMVTVAPLPPERHSGFDPSHRGPIRRSMTTPILSSDGNIHHNAMPGMQTVLSSQEAENALGNSRQEIPSGNSRSRGGPQNSPQASGSFQNPHVTNSPDLSPEEAAPALNANTRASRAVSPNLSESDGNGSEHEWFATLALRTR